METDNRREPDDTFRVRTPRIAVPAGGGAIRGIGEKFTTNPVTGTGRLSVPLSVTPGRSGFGPQLALSYDSGAGNGPFGLGWTLGLPAITRKTDRGLPQYNDAAESDVFLLSGTEDLVPVLVAAGGGDWVPEQIPPQSINGLAYDVRRYRPRIEGLFARIERWTRGADIFWRSISRDNITTYYGRTPGARIVDLMEPSRIFGWLISESHDANGNVVVYDYKPEDSANVDVGQAHERNRADTRTANRYLQRIRYGNTPSRLDPAYANGVTWHFEVVFDYGEGYYAEQTPDARGRVYATAAVQSTPAKPWPARPDPFSTYRSAFEVRTYRLCRRALMFHRFAELGAQPVLVRSTEFTYDENPIATRLISVAHCGFAQDAGRGLLKRTLPPTELTYSPAPAAASIAQQPIQDVSASSLENLPVGLDNSRYEWADLDGEGLSGILTRDRSAWYYKPNLGGGRFGPGERTHFRPVEAVRAIPAAPARAQLLDLAGDGQLDLVILDAQGAGFYERRDDSWDPFRTFASTPNVVWRDPNLRFLDLTGDGLADIAITEDDAIVWYPSLAEEGFGPAQRVSMALDDERGPRLVFAEPLQSVFLADMSGDGLADLVRIRNGEVCYWPNVGYGRFGAKVVMDHAPWFDANDQFEQRRIRLADIDGSGATDIVYLHRDGPRVYFNQSGNSWSEAVLLPQLPRIDDHSSVDVIDLLGSGTACLVWSSPLAGDRGHQLQYVDLSGGTKPHLLTGIRNNFGAETAIEYAPSTRFYLEDKLAGIPWETRLPFPVHCVARITVTDTWQKSTFTTTYRYRHGYYDGAEREFRGFARVDQIDAESYGASATHNAGSPYITSDTTLYQPPVKTVTWFHTGMAIDRARALASFADEYFPRWFEASHAGRAQIAGGFIEHELPDVDLASVGWPGDEWREALRACKGSILRQEVVELDVDELAAGRERVVKLYSAAQHSWDVRRLQGRGANRHAVFLVTEREQIAYQYELDLRFDTVTPDPRTSHSLQLQTDEYGNVLQSVSVGYPRAHRFTDPSGTIDITLIRAAQDERHVLYSDARFTAAVSTADAYRLPAACEARTFELTAFTPSHGSYFSILDFTKYRLSSVHQTAGLPVADWQYHERPANTTAGRRLVEQSRTLFLKDDLSGALPFASQGALGLVFETYKLALTNGLLTDIFGAKLADPVPTGGTARALLDDPAKSGYLSGPALAAAFPDLVTTGQYWLRSGRAGFAPGALQSFVLPERYTDAFGSTTTVAYDTAYRLWIASIVDPMGNTTAVTSMDLRVLAPTAITDHNANITEACFDAFGLTIATALRGKGNQGDSLTGFDTALANPDRDAQRRLFVTDYDETEPRRLLAGATARYAYYFGDDIIAGVLTWAAHPAAACAILRDTHEAALAGGATSPVEAAFEYTDGLGAVIVKKTLAEPDPAVAGQARRWIATGKTIRNNKGSAVKQYEPYFTAHHRFEEPQEVGVTPILYYDAPGRLVRTELPDGTFSRVDFGPWRAAHWDANDTVKESRWYAERGSPDPAAPLQAGASGDTRAAWLAARHAGTPALTFFDSLGRDVVAVADLGIADANGRSKYVTLTKLDVEGKPLWIVDARGNVVMRYTLPATPGGDPLSDYVTAYDIAGTLLFQHSMDAGDRWMLPDAGGKPLLAWDRNGSSAAAHDDRLFLTQYDLLHRPVAQWLSTTGGAGQQIERLEYCDTAGNATLAADQQNNLLGKPRKHYDPSGLTELVRVDFKGNTAEIRRTLTNQYDHSAVDWQQPQGKLEAETYASITEFDALSRPVRIFNWHRLGTGSRVAVYTPRYNERGLLVGEQLEIGSVTTANGYTPPAAGAVMAVAEVRYDAKGQKTSLALGNGTLTRYAYDRDTFRLTQMVTTRTNAATTPPFPQYHAALSDANTLQQLSYTYDAVGNITEITDEAFAPVFFQNRAVDARNRYEYDALYRLIRASGRENGASIGPPRYVEGAAPRVQFPVMTADPQAQRRYTQSFAYDEVGNVMQIQHAAGIGSWTRQFTPDTASNRLLASQDGGATPVSYRGDLHGNMLNLAGTSPAQDLRWDFRDMIASVDLAGGGRAYYAYDSGKQRTRKRLVRATGSGGIEDRVYLGGYERYRRYAPGNTTTPVEEIESHHLLEGDERVLLVDDVVRASGRSYPRSDGLTVPAQTLFRYQYGNHLGSACLELDEQVRIISYEEYHPYGTSAYWLVDATVEAPPKRYRYTGMERDEETGLSYHGARYYVPGLIRWVSADPAGIQEGVNVFRPLLTNPIAFRDTTGRQPDIPVKLPERLYRPGALLGVCRDKVPSVTAEDVRDRRDDGPQMYAADPAWLVASKSANSVFPPKQQEIFEQTIRGPVVAAAAPGVAVAAGALGIAHGTYYLATGDYEKAMAAYAFSLEFLPNVSTEFALTANQRMSLAIKESQFLLEREYVQASLANQAAAHTLHTNVALTVTQARARADELASFVLDKGMADLSKAQASREFGPVASVAVDTQTGEYGVGLNIQRGRGLPPTDAEMQNLRESLHPVLRARFDALQAHAAELVRTGQVTDDVARAGVAGTHSEFIALNNAIKAREALTGVAVTADDLADFVIVNRGLVGPFAGQNMPPPCYNCSILIRGTTMGQ